MYENPSKVMLNYVCVIELVMTLKYLFLRGYNFGVNTQIK